MQDLLRQLFSSGKYAIFIFSGLLDIVSIKCSIILNEDGSIR
jgi:hypothetical protein